MHRLRSPKRAGTWTLNHVQEPTATCTGPEARKGSAQGRGSTSRGLPTRAQVERHEKGRHRGLDPRPGDDSHGQRSNSPKRAGTGTWIFVQGPTGTCTGPERTGTGTWNHIQGPTDTRTCRTARNGTAQGRGSTSRGLPPRAQVEQPEKGWHKDVDTRPWAYRHGHKSYSPKRAGTRTWIHVQRSTATCTGRTPRKGPVQGQGPTATCTGQAARKVPAQGRKPRPGVYRLIHRWNILKRAGTGTWNHVLGPTATCTGRTARKVAAPGRGTTFWCLLATCTGRTVLKGPAQGRGTTSRDLRPRAQVEQSQKGRHRNVEVRPGAYGHVHRSNSPKSAGTGRWNHV